MKRILFILALIASYLSVQAQDTPLRIVTYNIRRDGPEAQQDRLWVNRKPNVMTLLRFLDPDIVGLQEVTDTQLKDLACQLDNFMFIGQGRGTSWLGRGTDEATPIAYKRSRFHALEQGTFRIDVKQDSPLGWMPWHVAQTGLLPRVCTWAKFKDKDNGKEFYVYNTHLDHKIASARIHQIKNVMHDIQNRTQGLPVIITGDFNARFEGDLKKECRGFIHAKERAESIDGPEQTSTGWDHKKQEWIDHILIKAQGSSVRVHSVITTNGYPSDHRPVFAEIAV